MHTVIIPNYIKMSRALAVTIKLNALLTLINIHIENLRIRQ